MKIVLMTPVRLYILESSANQLAYNETRRKHRNDAHAKAGIRLAFEVNFTYPCSIESEIICASIAPSMHSAIISFACERFLPHETAPCTFGAVTTYPPISASDSNTTLNDPYWVFTIAVFIDDFAIGLSYHKNVDDHHYFNRLMPEAERLVLSEVEGLIKLIIPICLL